VRTVCVTLTDDRYGKFTPHADHMRAHFAERGVDAQMFYGIHAQRIGVNAVVTSAVIAPQDPDQTHSIGMMPTGCWLSHRALWAALLLLPDDAFFVVESDARFEPNWRARFDAALRDVPDNWDMLYVGSCCTSASRMHVRGDVYSDARPQCTHAYCVRKKALRTLCEVADQVGARKPVDTMLATDASTQLRIYTVIPRIVDQYDANIPP